MKKLRCINTELSEGNKQSVNLKRKIEALSEESESEERNRLLEVKYEAVCVKLKERDEAAKEKKKKPSFGKRLRNIFSCTSARRTTDQVDESITEEHPNSHLVLVDCDEVTKKLV